MDTVRVEPELPAELRGAVMRLRRRLVAERDPANDLSIPSMAVLGALYRHGEMTVGGLAAFEGVQPPTMTRTVNCLERDGHVARRPHESDGRQVLVALTGSGRDLVDSDRTRRDRWLTRQLDELSDDDLDLVRRVTPLLLRLSTED